MKVFNFVLVPQGNYCEECLLSTRSISLINFLFMLLLLLASLCNQSRLFVSFPIPYFFLQEEKQVIPCPDLKLSQNFFKFMLS